MASLSRRDREFDADLWADLAARLLGVMAALGLAALGLILLFPSVGAGHLPVLPLGAAEPQRPLIGLLFFSLAGIVATVVMLFKAPEPPVRKPQPAPREMNLAPVSPAQPPTLAPFPAAEPWRLPEPPAPLVHAVEEQAAATPEPEPAPPATEVTPDTSIQEAPPAPQLEETVHRDVVQLDAGEPAMDQSDAEHLDTGQSEPGIGPEAVEPAPLVDADSGEAAEPIYEPPAPARDDDFEAKRQKLRATLSEANALAAALSAQASGDHQHALAAQDVGDAALASGAPDRAADAYDSALLHARALMEAHPEASAVRSVLAEVLTKIGDLNAAKGRMGAALGAYEEAISHRREAVRLGEGDNGRLGLAAALEILGRIRQSRGDADKARALYAESLEHLAPLAAADPRHGDMAYRTKLSLLALDRGESNGVS